MRTLLLVGQTFGFLLQRSAHLTWPRRFVSCSFPLLNRAAKQEIASSFRQWLIKTRNPHSIRMQKEVQMICNVLTSGRSTSSVPVLESALSNLNIKLTEECVTRVLKRLPSNALIGLRFFEWAGKQDHYRHTTTAYYSFFKLLKKAGMRDVLMQWLDSFQRERKVPGARFYECLVIGHAFAGEPHRALQQFAKMRYQGLDLRFQRFSYNVLLDGLLKGNCIDVARFVYSHISSKRRLSPDLSEECFWIRTLCKEGRYEEAQDIFSMDLRGHHDTAAALLVDGLCKCHRFGEARMVIAELKRRFGPNSTNLAYESLILGLLKKGREAVAFLIWQNSSSLGFVPRTSLYNPLIRSLLRYRRIGRAYQLMLEMKKRNIRPDIPTVNALLFAIINEGPLDLATEFFDGRLDMGFLPNDAVFNKLICSLCRANKLEDASRLVNECLNAGFSLSQKTCFVLLSSLQMQGKIDELQNLVDKGIQNFIPTCSPTGINFISALCIGGKALVERLLLPNKTSTKALVLRRSTYSALIEAFCSAKMGEMGSYLLLEMQEHEKCPSRYSFRMVIKTLCQLGFAEQVIHMLDMHVSRYLPSSKIYNIFISSLFNAKFPELAVRVFDKMKENVCTPTTQTYICMLHGYLKCNKVVDAFCFFEELSKVNSPCIRLYSVMISGLCKTGKIHLALMFFDEMSGKNRIPKSYCIEDLLRALCKAGMFSTALNIFMDITAKGRSSTTYMYNIFLMYLFKREQRNKAQVLFQLLQGSSFHPLVAALSMNISNHFDSCKQHSNLEILEEMIEKSFVPNTITYNILLGLLCKERKIGEAYDLFNRMQKKGCAPNMFTYDILLQGYCKADMVNAAQSCLKEMIKNGFNPSRYGYHLFLRMMKRCEKPVITDGLH